MHIFLIFAILIVGSSGIVAQILILRELLVSFCGNEMTVGIILGNWILAEALGVYLIGRISVKIKESINLFFLLEVLFCLVLPVSIYFSRIATGLFGISFGEISGLGRIFLISLAVVLPPAFCHGALFNVSSVLFSGYAKDTAFSLARVYFWETLGTIIGGIILTYLFIPYLNSFKIVLVVVLLNLTLLLFILKYIGRKEIRYVYVSLIIGMIMLIILRGPGLVQGMRLNRQANGAELLEERNSVYGNVAVVKQARQYTFYYNGAPVITVPYPDVSFTEDFAHLPLLFAPEARNILILSGGAGGLIREILKHPIENIDYTELDPLLLSMIKKYPTSLTKSELSDPRVRIINTDGRYFLRGSRNQYDCILLGLGAPTDLSGNRFFTREFFSLAKTKLRPKGILALWLPGSSIYTGSDLAALNSCIYFTLKSVYDNVRVIPGEYNIFLASGSEGILDVNASVISQRIDQAAIKTNILIPEYIAYRLEEAKFNQFMRFISAAPQKINRDLGPQAVYRTLILWNRRVAPSFALMLGFLGNINLGIIAVLILVTTVIISGIFKFRPALSRLNYVYSIFTTGFFVMLMNLALVFSFQTAYGYLYYQLGLLISILMAGIACGSLIMSRYLRNITEPGRLFMRIEIAILVFSCVAGFLIVGLFRGQTYIYALFIMLFFLSGFFGGLEFPLAGKVYAERKDSIAKVSGTLYAADLLGGWLAGMLVGVILLPVLGIFNTCITMAMVKLGNVVLLKTCEKPLTRKTF